MVVASEKTEMDTAGRDASQLLQTGTAVAKRLKVTLIEQGVMDTYSRRTLRRQVSRLVTRKPTAGCSRTATIRCSTLEKLPRYG